MLRAMGSLYNLKKVRHEGEFAITTATGKTRIWDFQSQPLPKLPDGRRVVLSLVVDITSRHMKIIGMYLRTLMPFTKIPIGVDF